MNTFFSPAILAILVVIFEVYLQSFPDSNSPAEIDKSTLRVEISGPTSKNLKVMKIACIESALNDATSVSNHKQNWNEASTNNAIYLTFFYKSSPVFIRQSLNNSFHNKIDHEKNK